MNDDQTLSVQHFEDRIAAFVEYVDDRFDVIAESLSFMATKADFQTLMERLEPLEGRVNFIEHLLAKHDEKLESHEAILAEHENQLARFEALKQKYGFGSL
jgi:hypothetical protein